MLKFIFAATALVAASSSLAQVEIVESQPVSAQKNIRTSPAASGNSDPNMQNEMYFQLQMLQQEVLELRGLVEEQAFELKRLKQQRLDDYLDLDRRIGQLGKPSNGPTKGATASNATVNAPVAIKSNPEKNELAEYRAAIDLVLKKRDFDGGAKALHTYLEDFPNGHYVANAQYWLGQIYYQKNDPENSEKWFASMIREFPKHHKTPEAKFKLAKLLQKKGDISQAKSLLNDVAKSSSSVAAMAQEALKALN